ncbi:MAG: hypothetical protein FWE64_03565 [Alphaproteobacteria bacterium]|nr:hypothetical protein [Alphaproteobacteria bacterium]
MKFTNFFVAALFAAVFAFGVHADTAIPFGEAAVFHMQQQQFQQTQQPQSPRARAATPNRAGGAAAPQAAGQGRGTAARPQTGQQNRGAPTARDQHNRGVVARTAVQPAAAGVAQPVQSRAVAPQGRPGAMQGRAVAPRAATPGRTVTARSGTVSPARIGVGSNPVTRPPAALHQTNLSNRLFTGSFTNILDPQTGLISAEAFAQCMDAYYTCMDEICTARNPGQRRCACAGRVLTFNVVEQTLQQAREDLLRASGELALVIASGGRDITAAFTLTDAERVLNCVAFRDASMGGTTDALRAWCENNFTAIVVDRGLANLDCTNPTASQIEPTYCSKLPGVGGGTLGGQWMQSLSGMDSNILNLLSTAHQNLAALDTLTADFSGNAIFNASATVQQILNQWSGANNVFGVNQTADQVAQTWGYDLFAFAHNNVCNRVLDSCFNGIFEVCTNNRPQNLNSTVTISNDATDINSVFTIAPQTPTTGANWNAACFGYSGTQGDPFINLRKPVSDARRSILIRYVLDANADCDVYGEELKSLTQNMAFQRIAATQALQTHRLQFAQNEETNQRANSEAARNNFSACVSEIWMCYEELAMGQPNWTTAQIRAACAVSARIPACYRDMICNPPHSAVAAVIDVVDSITCTNSQDFRANTCRNVTSLAEIMNGTGITTQPSNQPDRHSAWLREQCLRGAGVEQIRNWARPIQCPQNSHFTHTPGTPGNGNYVNSNCVCNTGWTPSGGICVPVP